MDYNFTKHPLTPEYEEYAKRQETRPLLRPEHFRNSYKLYMIDGVALDDALLPYYYDFTKRTNTAREGDIFVVSFPKTGTTWVQEIAFLIGSNLDFAQAKAKTVDERVVFLEWPAVDLAELEKLEAPRFFKTHLPYSLLSPAIKEKSKIIYVTRNPKDTVVSMYYFYRMMGDYCYTGTCKDFLQFFINDLVTYAPFGRHALEFWEHRNDENILYLFYEDLKMDPGREIAKIAKFLGKSLTDEQISAVTHHTTFKEMAHNPATNYSHWDDQGVRVCKEVSFMRKGMIGDWKNHFDQEMNEMFDVWYQKNFNNTSLKFTFE